MAGVGVEHRHCRPGVAAGPGGDVPGADVVGLGDVDDDCRVRLRAQQCGRVDDPPAASGESVSKKSNINVGAMTRFRRMVFLLMQITTKGTKDQDAASLSRRRFGSRSSGDRGRNRRTALDARIRKAAAP